MASLTIASADRSPLRGITSMSKSALVVGGAGFIGSHLVDFLYEKKYQVTVVDNFVTGQKKNLAHLMDKGIKLIEADVCKKETLPWTQRFDEIYNLASPASPVDFDTLSIEILLTASQGNLNLLEMAKNQGSKILLASTSEVYGDPLVHPQVETYFGNVNTMGHRSCYDEGKRYAEALFYNFHKRHGVDIRIIRIFNTYGPRMRLNDGRVIPNFFTQSLKKLPLSIYGNGEQTRSLCYVSDMVNGMHTLMQSNVTIPVNIGNPREMTINQIAHEVNRLTGNDSKLTYKPLPENDPLVRRPDISRANKLLNWKPQVDLSVGLKSTLDYFKKELGL